jgi:hypothetical protein
LQRKEEGGDIMTSKKDLIIAVLITFCLTATLFTIIPTKSGDGSSYDPWKDLNDDGVIDSTDLGMLGTSWATTGDPTKNVNVTNWPIDELGNLKVKPTSKLVKVWDGFYMSWTGGTTSVITTVRINVEGYSVMYVWMRVSNISPNQQGTTNVQVTYLGWLPDISQYGYVGWEGAGLPKLTLSGVDTDWAFGKYEIKAQGVYFNVAVASQQYSGSAYFYIYVYLRNE